MLSQKKLASQASDNPEIIPPEDTPHQLTQTEKENSTSPTSVNQSLSENNLVIDEPGKTNAFTQNPLCQQPKTKGPLEPANHSSFNPPPPRESEDSKENNPTITVDLQSSICTRPCVYFRSTTSGKLFIALLVVAAASKSGAPALDELSKYLPPPIAYIGTIGAIIPAATFYFKSFIASSKRIWPQQLMSQPGLGEALILPNKTTLYTPPPSLTARTIYGFLYCVPSASMLYLLIHKTYPEALVILLPSATGLVNFFVGFDKTGHFIAGCKKFTQWLRPNDNTSELLQKYITKQLELTLEQHSERASELLAALELPSGDLEAQDEIPFSTSPCIISFTLRTDTSEKTGLKEITVNASDIMQTICEFDARDQDFNCNIVEVDVSGTTGTCFKPVILTTLTLLAAAAVTSNYLSVALMLQKFCDFEFLEPIGGMGVWAYVISLFSSVAPFSINEEVVLDWSNGISISMLGADYSFQFENTQPSSPKPSCCNNKLGTSLLYTLIYVCTILQGIQGEVYTRTSASGTSNTFMKALLLTLGLVTMLFMIVTKFGAMEAFVLEKAGVLSKEQKEQQKQSKLWTEKITMSVNMLITIMKACNELTKDTDRNPLFNIQQELKTLTEFGSNNTINPPAMHQQINHRLGLYCATLNGIRQLKQSQQEVLAIRDKMTGSIDNGILNGTQTESSITSALHTQPQDQNGYHLLGEERKKASAEEEKEDQSDYSFCRCS